jgi:hypothetical protein
MEKTINPKVKIRVEDKADNSHGKRGFKIGSLFTLKDVQSLFSTHDSTTPVAVMPQDNPPSPVVRIPKNYVPSVFIMPKVSDLSVYEDNKQIDDLEKSINKVSLNDKQINEEDRSSSSSSFTFNTKQNDDDDKPNLEDSSNKNKQNDDGEDKLNIWATPVPRPRAVLSSPDNDVVVGSKNKTTAPRTPALQNCNPIPNWHLQCQVTPSNDDNGSTINTRKPWENPGNESPLNTKKPKEHIGNESPINTRKPKEHNVDQSPINTRRQKEHIGNESPINTRKQKEHIGNESPINMRTQKEHIGNESPINTKKPTNDVADKKSGKKVPPQVSVRSPGRIVKTSKPRPVWI